MSLVYGQATSDAFFALLDDTQVVDVTYTHSATTLESAITTTDPALSYDDFHHRLIHTGLLTATMQGKLMTVSGVSADFQTAVTALFDQSEAIKGLFFTRYPELLSAYTLASAAAPADRHAVFLSAFTPELAQLRKRQQAAQRLSAAAGVPLAYPQTLLDPPTVPYPLHAAADKARAGLDDVVSLQTPGLTASFYFRSTATGNIDLVLPHVADLNYDASGSNPLPNPGNPVSVVFSGQVEAPETGYFNLIVETDSTAAVTLDLADQVQSLTKNGSVWRNANPIQLKAGQLVDLSIKVENIQNALSMEWETPKLPRQSISARYLYPPFIMQPFSDLYTRFLKAASLATGLSLTVNELTAFAVDPDYAINADGWLNALPVSGSSAQPDLLLKPFQALLDFARLKADLSPSDESLLSVLKDPVTATQDSSSLLFSLTLWNPDSLANLLTHFSSTIASLGHFAMFLKVADAFAILQQMGISASVLIQATTNEPSAADVSTLQAALRALYDDASWRDVIKPINDDMRSLQRDALVAYILHQMTSHPESANIDSADRLFEYFLMDVEMDPCMQTSRIRHALSSVQLFVERCLMNLEPRVSPAALNAEMWSWMKRYRIWEANRKVFLYPENWLEPELRDNKSPFFKEIESELLQSDITEDTATTALLNYLSKLEEVAKLEPCGFFNIPADLALQTPEVTHVVARTAGASRKYYYRRYENPSWTPWEQVKLDIEDNPVIPVVWNDRLLLFWLRLLKQGPDDPGKPFVQDGSLSSMDTSNMKTTPPKVLIKVVLCWSEYYNGKWQPAKTSDVNQPLLLDEYDAAGTSAFDRTNIGLRAAPENDGLRIRIIGSKRSFLMYNTHSLPVSSDILPDPGQNDPNRERLFSGDYQSSMGFEYIELSPSMDLDRDILQPDLPFKLVRQNGWRDDWDTPFFMEDSRHVFYVDTEEVPLWIRDHYDYGVQPESPGLGVLKVPPLELAVDPSIPKKPDPGEEFVSNLANPGEVDPTPVARFVSEDANVSKVIQSTTSVSFSETSFNPSGSTKNVQEGG
jgi:hypothetical protein